MDNIASRFEFANQTCRAAGEIAAQYFADRGSLAIEVKGAQDWVSEADKNVETFIRKRIADAWPDDGVFGEEHGSATGSSGFDWVIDPIDGTTNFVNGIPAWTIVLAGVSNNRTELGVIHDPNFGETFTARRGQGGHLNGAAMRVASGIGLESGTVSVGYSNRVEAAHVVPVIADIVSRGALYHRNASGALSLAYVAAGRMLGYLEEHMNAWDCLAGQLMIEEAGGKVENQNAGDMIREGGRVVASAPDIFDDLCAIANAHWSK